MSASSPPISVIVAASCAARTQQYPHRHSGIRSPVRLTIRCEALIPTLRGRDDAHERPASQPGVRCPGGVKVLAGLCGADGGAPTDVWEKQRVNSVIKR